MSHRMLHYSIAFLMQLFISVGSLALSLLATQIGASNVELGIIGMLGLGTYALTVVGGGALSDKLGRKRVIVAGSLATGLTFALMPLSRVPVHLMFLNAISGVAMAFFWPVLEAWLSEDGNAEQIKRGLSGFNVSWSAGGCLGPLLSGFIYTISSTFSFLFAAAGTFLVAYLAYLHKRPAVSAVPGACQQIRNEENSRLEISRTLLYIVWIANFAGWFAICELRILFPKLGLDVLGMQPKVIGALIFALGLALTAMFYLMGASRRWHSTTAPLFYAETLIIILLLATAVAKSALTLGLIFAGLGAAFGVGYSYSLYYSVVGSAQKGAASGRHEMVLGTGGLLGPLLGGVAAEIFKTQRAPYVLGAALVLVSIVAQAFLLASSRSERPPNSPHS